MFERKLEDEGSFFASNREKSRQRQWSQKTNQSTSPLNHRKERMG
jgi:hypothetical protein